MCVSFVRIQSNIFANFVHSPEFRIYCKYLIPQHNVMSLVYRGLKMLHYMDLPSAGRRLKANLSGVIAFHFSIDVVANTVFGSHKTKKLTRT